MNYQEKAQDLRRKEYQEELMKNITKLEALILTRSKQLEDSSKMYQNDLGFLLGKEISRIIQNDNLDQIRLLAKTFLKERIKQLMNKRKDLFIIWFENMEQEDYEKITKMENIFNEEEKLLRMDKRSESFNEIEGPIQEIYAKQAMESHLKQKINQLQ